MTQINKLRLGIFGAVLALVVILAVISYGYALHWDIAFSSDIALVGLMAKHIALNGEHPIFVWGVGYQGIWLEGYLTAFYFKLFGVSPTVACLAPITYFGLALAIWTATLKKAFNWPVAWVSALFTIVSVPYLYYLNFRTLPNFPEAFLIGSLALWVYLKLIPKQSSLALAAILGLLTGFGTYTFAIADYFIITAGAHLIFRYLRNQYQGQGVRVFGDLLLPFGRFARPGIMTHFIKILGWLAWGLLAFGLITFFLSTSRLNVNGHVYPWDPLSALLVAGFILLAINVLHYTLWAPPRVLQHWLAFVLGTLVGYSPALYYKFILGGKTIKRIGMGGGLNAVWNRLQFLAQSNSLLISSNAVPFLGTVATLLTLSAFLIFLAFQLRQLQQDWKKQESLGPPQASLLFLFLPLVMILIFLTARMVTDRFSTRYLIFLVPLYALGIAWCAGQLWSRFPKPWMRAITISVLLLILSNNAITLIQDIKRGGSRPQIEALVKALDQNEIRYGYADYMFAYALDFYTNERLVLEPLESNYCPHYGPIVTAKKTVGYLTAHTARPKPIGSRLDIYRASYEIKRFLPLTAETDLYFLERDEIAEVIGGKH